MSNPKTALVLSAHAADFRLALWRRDRIACRDRIRGDGGLHVVRRTGRERAALERRQDARRGEGDPPRRGRGRREGAGGASPRMLRSRRLPVASGAGGQRSSRRSDPRRAARVDDEPQRIRPLQHRPHVHDRGRAAGADDRTGLGSQSGRTGVGGTAALSVRAAPDRTDGMETRCLPRHHPGLGQEARRDGAHERGRSISGTITRA